MKKKITVLGAGLVGKAMAIDLAARHDVTSVDLRAETLKDLEARSIRTVQADFTEFSSISHQIAASDLVIGAVPGFLGFNTAKSVIAAGKNMVDISFFPEDAFLLDSAAKSAGVTVVTDCGVAPGMGNIILGYHNKRMKIDSYECLVGGLPVKREWPFEYKAVFSPIDVIEEYIRPARFVKNGTVVVREALSDAELVHFDEVGTLESWNSDGLRSLIKTMHHIPDMIEKTLRYPGCVEYLRVLREAGFFSYEPVDIQGVKVRPIDVTARLVFPKWKLKPGEEEFTVMRIRISGTEEGNEKTYEYSLFDKTDAAGTLSMARTTGYTATAVAERVLNGGYSRKGISPPEFVGENEDDFSFVVNYLKERGVHYRKTFR